MIKQIVIILILLFSINITEGSEKKMMKGWDINNWGFNVNFISNKMNLKELNTSLSQYPYSRINENIPLFGFGLKYGKYIPVIDTSEHLEGWEKINNWLYGHTSMTAAIFFSPNAIFPGMWEYNLRPIIFNIKSCIEIPVTDYFRLKAIIPSVSYLHYDMVFTKYNAFGELESWEEYSSASLSFGIGAGFDFLITNRYYNENKEINRSIVIGVDFEYNFMGTKGRWTDISNGIVVSRTIAGVQPNSFKINLNFGFEIEKREPFNFIKEELLNP
ncbi:MAG: hypothetical protein EPN82_14065 [Bacteroidetes bacterium]|nr:MAG: hypothetical protein EPN82_14065 [Bacteroidota bacterium]